MFRLKVLICQLVLFSHDCTMLLSGIIALSVILTTNRFNINDSRITLSEACLESDSAGYVHMLLVWGIFMAVTISLISMLGVYSNMRKSPRLLFFYSSFAHVLALMELLFFLTLYVHLQRASTAMEVCLKEVLVRYYNGPFHSDVLTFSGAWDHLFRGHKCCGVDGGDIFTSMSQWNRTWMERYSDPFFDTSVRMEEFRVVSTLPYTCCRYQDENNRLYMKSNGPDEVMPFLLDPECPFFPTINNSYIDVGCYDLLQGFVSTMSKLILYCSSAREIWQMAAALCALYVAKSQHSFLIIRKLKEKGLMD